MHRRMNAWEIPVRFATAVFSLCSGLCKHGADKVGTRLFERALSAAEMTIGTALLLPVARSVRCDGVGVGTELR